MKVRKTITMDQRIAKVLDDNCLRHGDVTWHVESALTAYFPALSGKAKPKKEVKAKGPVVKVVEDYSESGFTCDQMMEVLRVRALNKGGAVSSRVAKAIGKEFRLASEMGYTFDDLITEWEVRGWKSFKAEWLQSKQAGSASTRDIPMVEQLADRSWAK